MRLPWLCLLIAAVFEVGWPLGFKLSQTTRFKWPFIALAEAMGWKVVEEA